MHGQPTHPAAPLSRAAWPRGSRLTFAGIPAPAFINHPPGPSPSAGQAGKLRGARRRYRAPRIRTRTPVHCRNLWVPTTYGAPTGGGRCCAASARSLPGVTISRIPAEPVDGQRPGKQGQPRPVRPCQPRRGAGPLAQGDSELMAQHQDLGVLPPLLPPRQPQQRHGTGYGQEDQLQPHEPKIIARPEDPRQARPALDPGLRSAEHLPR